jgi:alkanesulfonate monooxygenase SsuD/methylene tetrahydromethanopterin reductase-like flavin-dependent oxidoreductase (luciferase family)
MSTQRRGVALTPMETRYDIILRTAQLADELGYEAFALPEGWGLDATLLLTEAASRTRRPLRPPGRQAARGHDQGPRAPGR